MVLLAYSVCWPLEAFWLTLLGCLAPTTESVGLRALITWLHRGGAGRCPLTDIPTESLSAERDIYGCHPQRKEPDTIHVLLTRLESAELGWKPRLHSKTCIFPPVQSASCSWWMRNRRRSDDRANERKDRSCLGRPKHQRRNEKTKQEKQDGERLWEKRKPGLKGKKDRGASPQPSPPSSGIPARSCCYFLESFFPSPLRAKCPINLSKGHFGFLWQIWAIWPGSLTLVFLPKGSRTWQTHPVPIRTTGTNGCLHSGSVLPGEINWPCAQRVLLWFTSPGSALPCSHFSGPFAMRESPKLKINSEPNLPSPHQAAAVITMQDVIRMLQKPLS